MATATREEADSGINTSPRPCVRDPRGVDVLHCIVHDGTFTADDKSRMPKCSKAKFDEQHERVVVQPDR